MFFRRFSAFRGIGKGGPEATQQELIAGHRQRRRVPIDTVCEVIWKPHGEHSRVDVFAHARKVHRDVYRCQPFSARNPPVCGMAVYVSAKIVGYPLPVTLKRAGELIQRARDATGMDIAALATRVGQSPSTIRRLESGDTEPSVEQGNALVAALPISAEELLSAMGVHLSLPPAARLPRQLVDLLGDLNPEQFETLIRLLRERRRAGHPVPGVRHVVLHGHRTPGER